MTNQAQIDCPLCGNCPLCGKPLLEGDKRRPSEIAAVCRDGISRYAHRRAKLTEGDVLRQEAALEAAKWPRSACGTWEDPITGLKHPSTVAYEILRQRGRKA